MFVVIIEVGISTSSKKNLDSSRSSEHPPNDRDIIIIRGKYAKTFFCGWKYRLVFFVFIAIYLFVYR